MIRLEARPQQSQTMALWSPVLAILCTICVGMILFSILGKPPLEGLYIYFIQPISSFYGFSELLVKATPLILIAVGLAIGFRANVWNIGAEGQLTMGAILGGSLAVFFPEGDLFLMLPLMMLLGILGGMFWAAFPAWLKTHFNANEILTSLMLTYVAQLILSYLVHGPWRDPDGMNFPETVLFPDAATMPLLLEDTRVHLGSLFALFVVAAGWILVNKSVIGFQLKAKGQAPAAACFAGFKDRKLVWFALLLSGGLAGFAGLSEVSGPIGQLVPSISPGYGFTAIIVAFLGRLNPLGILFAGLIMALSYLGGETAQIEMGLSAAVTGVFQGFLLFFLLACDVLIHYRIRFGSFHKSSGRIS